MKVTPAIIRKWDGCRASDFAEKYPEGVDAVALLRRLQEVSPQDGLWLAARVLPYRQRVLWACQCAREAAVHNPDPRVLAAIETAERCARKPTKKNKKAAEAAAKAAEAAAKAAEAAAWAAAWAAEAAAWAAAWAAEAAAWAAEATAKAALAAGAAGARRKFIGFAIEILEQPTGRRG